jgi:hypothetical protein
MYVVCINFTSIRIKSRAQVKAFDLLTLILFTGEYTLIIHLFMPMYQPKVRPNSSHLDPGIVLSNVLPDISSLCWLMSVADKFHIQLENC